MTVPPAADRTSCGALARGVRASAVNASPPCARSARDTEDEDSWICSSTRRGTCSTKHGVPVLAGAVAETPEEARAAAERLLPAAAGSSSRRR